MANATIVTWRPWVDQSFPHDFRVTLPYRTGATVQAIITAFITSIVFPAIWTIVAYVLHQFQTGEERQRSYPGRLQQAYLRNHSTPTWLVWKNLRILVDRTPGQDRRRPTRAVLASSFIATVAGLALVAFTVVSAIESAKVSTGVQDAVLIRSERCGLTSIAATFDTIEYATASANISRTRVLTAADYAKRCFRTSSPDSSCNMLTRSELMWTATNNASCPFKNGTCVFGNTAAYEMTTEMIDSHEDLGINAPVDQRVQMQKRTTCAPLRTMAYQDVVNDTSVPVPGGKLTRYFLGNTTAGNSYNVSSYAMFYGVDYRLT